MKDKSEEEIGVQQKEIKLRRNYVQDEQFFDNLAIYGQKSDF